MKKKIIKILSNGRKIFAPALLVLITVALSARQKAYCQRQTITWKLDNAHSIGDYKPELFGSPQLANDNGTTLSFNGVSDGLVMPKIPVEGWKQFTIEILFKPAGDGPREPRFMHFQDSALNRGTFELRLTREHQWYMDTFLKNGKTNKGLTLIDSTILHPTDQWYWVAMSYDGKKMTSYINGKKELEGEIDLPLFTHGSTALGVRLNKVSWFKGLIKEMRFHNIVLASGELQRPEN